MSFDDLRRRLPSLGFAVYAIEPGEPVTLEVYFGDGTIWKFAGWSEAEAVEAAMAALIPAPVATPNDGVDNVDSLFDDDEDPDEEPEDIFG